MEEPDRFKAILTTKGRVSGKAHSVKLLAVRHEGRIYFSRHMPDADWFKNALKTPDVTVQIGDKTLDGRAEMVRDENLAAKISALKYPGQQKAEEKRVAIEVTLHEQA